MKQVIKKGDKVICTQTSIIEIPMYLSKRRIVVHRDLILGEETIKESIKREKSNGRKPSIFVPILIVNRVYKGADNKQYIQFENGRKTPIKYQLHHVHSAHKFRLVNEPDRK